MHASYKMIAGAALFACAVLVPSEAHAGTVSPLSSIATMPGLLPLKTPEAITGIAGATVKSKDGYRGSRWHEVTTAAARGYCLTSTEGGFRWMSTYATSSGSNAEDLDLDRLVEKDGKVTLERTRVRFDPSDASLTATGRSRVELHEIARSPDGVVVWAYRDGRDVVVVTRNVDRGVESREVDVERNDFPFVSAEGCPFAGARLDARKPETGTFVQLAGNLAPRGTGKERVTPRFTVDASLSRVARDPEPRIAVRVRVRD
ncbi:MAG: hypothetical protein JWP87_3010 [Labilithrix sp.]|nr:hypothetical protein [Labilithrix sp.]